MLTHAEQMRIYRDMPDSFSITWDGEEYTYENIAKWWREQDHDKDYPEIVLGWDGRGIEKEDETPLNHVTDLENVGPDLDIERGIPMYDQLEVRFSVERGLNDDGVPGTVRSSEMGRKLLRYFRFIFEQNYQPTTANPSSDSYEAESTGEERPVLAKLAGEPTVVPEEMTEDSEMRAEFTVEIHYTSRHIDSVPTGTVFDSEADLS